MSLDASNKCWMTLTGRLFAVCGDGEFVIYTAQAW